MESSREQHLESLNHLVRRETGEAQWTWKKATVVVDSGAAQNVMSRSMFVDIVVK